VRTPRRVRDRARVEAVHEDEASQAAKAVATHRIYDQIGFFVKLRLTILFDPPTIRTVAGTRRPGVGGIGIMGREMPAVLRQLETARAEAARANARADALAGRLRKIERLVLEEGLRGAWLSVADVLYALGMDEHGRYTDGHTTAEG